MEHCSKNYGRAQKVEKEQTTGYPKTKQTIPGQGDKQSDPRESMAENPTLKPPDSKSVLIVPN